MVRGDQWRLDALAQGVANGLAVWETMLSRETARTGHSASRRVPANFEDAPVRMVQSTPAVGASLALYLPGVPR
jgi:hypothetical protein